MIKIIVTIIMFIKRICSLVILIIYEKHRIFFKFVPVLSALSLKTPLKSVKNYYKSGYYHISLKLTQKTSEIS